MHLRDLNDLVRLAGTLGLLAGAVACAKPLPITGAPCPCPEEYVCDVETKLCVPRETPPPGVRPPPAASPSDGAPGSRSSLADAESSRGSVGFDAQPGLGASDLGPLAQCGVPPPTAPRRLDHTEWTNTIRDLLGIVPPAPDLPVLRPAPVTQTRDEPTPPITDVELRQHRDLARLVANSAVRNLAALLPCDPKRDGEAVCGPAFVERFGLRAFRRPLRSDETEQFIAAFARGMGSGGFAGGITEVIASMIASPAFFVRREQGEMDSIVRVRGDAFVRLRPHELATRLSYLLTASTPDDELLRAAEQGELGSVGLARQAERLLAGPKAAAGFAHLVEAWLRLREGSRQAGSSAPAGFTKELVAGLPGAAEQQLVHLILDQGADLKTLLTWPDLVGDPTWSRFYGGRTRASLTPPWQILTPTPPDRRYGLLTLPAVLVYADGSQSNIVNRGVWILDRLLCEQLPAPPPSLVFPSPPISPNVTTRERFDMHSKNPACSVCHGMIDSVAYGLENYDGYGRWRDSERGKPIDATGQVGGYRFNGPAGLAAVLTGELEGKVSACVTRRWFAAALGQDNIDDCTLAQLAGALKRGQGKLRALLLGLVESDAFGTRRMPP